MIRRPPRSTILPYMTLQAPCHRGGAGTEAFLVAAQDRVAQRHDLVGLLNGRAPHLLEHGLQVGMPRIEEGIERLDAIGRGLLRRHQRRTIPMASLACTSTTSPTAASTRATLTSSSPEPVSTSARPSSRSSTTRTCTASSEDRK